jgi:23S rRNA pseudouridine2605 synthase
MSQRIAKFLAAAGICSRRQGEALIAAGRIKINDQIVTTPVTFVKSTDHVTFDNRTVQLNESRRIWAFYKPLKCITSRIDPEERDTIYDILPSSFKNIKYVGRLDYFSEGLLLLTNDGTLVRTLELPTNKIPRVYRVRVYGNFDSNIIPKLADGIGIAGTSYQKIQVDVESSVGKNTWLRLTLIEGKNREIRKIMAYLGYKVNRLIRTEYGPITLQGLSPGQVKELDINIIDQYIKD